MTFTYVAVRHRDGSTIRVGPFATLDDLTAWALPTNVSWGIERMYDPGEAVDEAGKILPAVWLDRPA